MRKSDTRPTARALRRTAVVATVAAGSLAAGGTALVAVPGAASAASCASTNVNGTGLSALVVASPGHTYSATYDATGCDIGIYVGPGVTGVTIDSATVTGANDHGIFAQDIKNSSLVIKNSTVDGNGVSPTAGIQENKAIELVGVTGAIVDNNTVYNNSADGGIGLADDGAVDPGAPKSSGSTPVASSNDQITNNKVYDNYSGCGIVVAAYNPGAGIGSGVLVETNTVTGAVGKFTAHGPVIGGIVVAADTYKTTVSGVVVQGNTVTQSAIPGVVVHSNAPLDNVSGVTVKANILSGNDWLSTDGPAKPVAILMAASQIPAPVTPVLTGTTVTGNSISNEFYGVWRAGDTSSSIATNTITTYPGGTAVYEVPAPWSGYWMAGADGSVYHFGTAASYGSMAGKALDAPVVGISPTQDQGGYVMAGADGGVFNFGDANFYGSMGGKTLSAPVVGIASTPYEQAVPPAQPNPAGKGYWMVAKDGGVFSFGDAKFYGSLGGKKLDAPIVGMAPTPDGHGYWLVGADGGVFAFGDANFYGSMGGKKLDAPVVGMAPTPGGHGYWLVGADGGVFAFGSARFVGSTGGKKLVAPVSAIVAGPGDSGYWLMAGDGGVFAFGSATFLGSEGGHTLPKPVIGAAGVGPTVSA